MPAKVVKRGNKYRVVEPGGKLVRRNGTSVDDGHLGMPCEQRPEILDTSIELVVYAEDQVGALRRALEQIESDPENF